MDSENDPTTGSRDVEVPLDKTTIDYLLHFAEPLDVDDAIECPAGHPSGGHVCRFAQHRVFHCAMFSYLRSKRDLGAASSYARTMDVDLTAEDLDAMIDTPEGEALVRGMTAYRSPPLGSKEHMNVARRRLQALQEQEGLPQVFFTLSAADTRWHHLARLMPGDIRTSTQRTLALARNPLLAAEFFRLRSDVWLREVVSKVFDVKWHFRRDEFQGRGSVHVHGILAFNGMPDTAMQGRVVSDTYFELQELRGEAAADEDGEASEHRRHVREACARGQAACNKLMDLAQWLAASTPTRCRSWRTRTGRL